MKKRLFSLALALVLALSLVLPALAAPSGYSDIPEDHWSAADVMRATQLGFFQGVGGGAFGRGQPITRAAFVTALVRLFDWEPVSPAAPTFRDVAADRWYYEAVETAYANGAFVATTDTFRPSDSITREELAVMLVRSLGYASLAGAISNLGSAFTDVTISRGYITMAYDMGIINGIGDGRFNPNGSATREQAAAVLMRTYDRLHAAPRRMDSAAGFTPISVPTPTATLDTAIPTTPLEPITELYIALRKARAAGTDLSQTALCLSAGGVRTVVANKRIAGSGPISAEEVEEILSRKQISLYYNTRYESAYCIYTANNYQTVTLWYQSGESLAAKLRLAALFGVGQYVLS